MIHTQFNGAKWIILFSRNPLQKRFSQRRYHSISKIQLDFWQSRAPTGVCLESLVISRFAVSVKEENTHTFIRVLVTGYVNEPVYTSVITCSNKAEHTWLPFAAKKSLRNCNCRVYLKFIALVMKCRSLWYEWPHMKNSSVVSSKLC